VQAIVEAGADINKPNPDGTTPLITALDNKNFDIAMYLLDMGANAEAWDMHGRTPLYVAVDMNSFTLRGFSSGFSFNRVEAREADRTTAMQVVNRLLDMGVDPNHQLTRIRPNGNGRDRFVDYMLRGGTGPLMVATLSHDHEAMQALLAHGAEVDLPNVFRITPLMAAAGVNGSARGSTTLPKVDDLQGHIIKTLDILLDAGADINARVSDSHTFTAKLDAYVKGRDHEGQTALFGAAELGFDRVVEHLLERGADPAIRDAAGNSALDFALAPVGSGTSAVTGPLMDEEGRKRLIPMLQALIPDTPVNAVDPAGN
jgi:ankyrin repeat protein